MLGTSKKVTKLNRTKRTRAAVRGTAQRPRLSVFRSNRYIYGQIIDDTKGMTLRSIDSMVKEKHEKAKKTDAAFELGKKIAKMARTKKIETVVFDKGPYKYHGRVKSFADGAREGGLVF